MTLVGDGALALVLASGDVDEVAAALTGRRNGGGVAGLSPAMAIVAGGGVAGGGEGEGDDRRCGCGC